MEAYCSLHSPTVTTIPSLSQSGFTEKPLLRGQVLKFSNSKRYPHARKLGFLHIKAQASGGWDEKSMVEWTWEGTLPSQAELIPASWGMRWKTNDHIKSKSIVG